MEFRFRLRLLPAAVALCCIMRNPRADNRCCCCGVNCGCCGCADRNRRTGIPLINSIDDEIACCGCGATVSLSLSSHSSSSSSVVLCPSESADKCPFGSCRVRCCCCCCWLFMCIIMLLKRPDGFCGDSCAFDC